MAYDQVVNDQNKGQMDDVSEGMLKQMTIAESLPYENQDQNSQDGLK